jgi:hypothetical protein
MGPDGRNDRAINNNGAQGQWRVSAPGKACGERSSAAVASKAEVVREDFVPLSLSEWGGGVRRSGDQCYNMAAAGEAGACSDRVRMSGQQGLKGRAQTRGDGPAKGIGEGTCGWLTGGPSLAWVTVNRMTAQVCGPDAIRSRN